MMKQLYRLLLIFLLSLLLSFTVFAGENESRHINYITSIFNEENGLPTGEANAVVQAQDGYLWIGGYGGLIRYDGSVFKDFSDRLESSAIRALYVAKDGTLYIGTNDAGAYMLRDDVFVPLRAEDEFSFLCIRDFAETSDGTICMASNSGVARLSGDRIVPYDVPKLENEQFLSLATDRFDNIWAVTYSKNIYIFNESRVVSQIASPELFDQGTIYSVCSDPDGSIYIGSSENTIVRISFGTSASFEGITTHSRSYYSTDEILTLNRLSSAKGGQILVSALNGFGILDPNGSFRRVDKPGENSLSANWAVTDHEGNYWVASSNYGVLRYSVGCFDSCNYNSNLGDHTINAVAKQGGFFYICTDTGVLLFDEDWKPAENALTQLAQGFRARNVTVDTAGRVWLATYSEHGALCYDPATETITDFGEAQGLNSNTVRVVYPLSDGRMLVGNQLGVNIIENGKITESYGMQDGMKTTSVLCAMELDGRLYVGTDGNGIYEITQDGLVNYSFAEGLSQGVVLRMEPDADGNGNYFVCAGDKLFYGENGRFRVLSGISKGSGSIYSAYDLNGRIWLLQNNGIYSADKAAVLAGQSPYTAQYGVKCGMTGTLNANTWNWLAEDGSLYIPTRSGVSVFYFHGPSVTMPRAILNSISVDDTLYEHPSAMEIPRNARRITVDISCLLFAETSEYMIGYQLDGFDVAESITMDKHISVSYTNLPGGSHTLRIRIVDPLTGQSTAEQRIPIQKDWQITERPLFYILCAVVLILLVGLLARFLMRRKTRALMKKQEEQRRYINEIIKAFSHCVDMRDHYTNGHSARVAKYTAMLAEKLGKSPEEVEQMYNIALLHDVGKIGIPDAVLNKPERLTDEEFALMKSHSQLGYEVLKEMAISPDLALGAGCHHERYDGKGYPAGLKGDEIPEVAQIIGVADTFDAMYSTRPYRKKMKLETVVAEIARGSGSQFNPRVVDAFLELVKDGTIKEE